MAAHHTHHDHANVGDESVAARGPSDAAGHEAHGDGHTAHDKHAGHDPEAFRRRFWLTLALTVPLVVTSEMVMEWFNYEISFWGMEALGPILGSAVFWWGGWPFLTGAVAEVRSRQPGMMLLIAMAITVAYVASMATSLDWLELEFWWELAALVTIMVLGHWQEMKAIGQARGALAALAELLPDDAEVGDGDAVRRSRSTTCASAMSCSSVQEAGSRPTARSSTVPRRRVDHRRRPQRPAPAAGPARARSDLRPSRTRPVGVGQPASACSP